ncbi:MAG: glycosyltransferase family 39 protein [Cyanobacteria bacterium]|nr:glycosyltransferase family 39 protein [Cyanobacteriota bacterium]
MTSTPVAVYFVLLDCKKRTEPYKNGSDLQREDSIQSVNGRQIAAVAALCFFIFFLGLGTYGLIDRSDAYYSEGTREMLETGQCLVPLLNYQTFYDKPILFFWLQIISYSIFGITEFGARFSSAFFATAATIATYLFAGRVINNKTGLLSALILCTSPMVVGLGRLALVDMTFCALLSSAMYLMYLRLAGAKRAVGALAYCFLGLAVLTKGPLGLILAVVPMTVFFLLTSKTLLDLTNKVRSLDIGLGLMVLLLVAAPWYMTVSFVTHGFWTDVFFLKGNLGRFNGSANHVHPQWWYFLPVIAYSFLPWFLFLPSSLYKAAVKQRFGRYVNFNGKDLFSRESLAIFLWSWIIPVFIIFSASKCKLHTYVLPLLPPAAILVGMMFSDWIDKWQATGKVSPYLKCCSFIVAISGILLIGLAVILLNSGYIRFLARLLPSLANPLSFVSDSTAQWLLYAMSITLSFIGIALLTQFALATSGRLQSAVKVLFGAMIALTFASAQVLFPLSYQLSCGDIHYVAGALRSKVDAPIVVYHEFRPSLQFYLHRPIDTAMRLDQFVTAESKSKLYIFCRASELGKLEDRIGKPDRVVARSKTWLVLAKSGIALKKLPELDAVLSSNLQWTNPELALLPLTAGLKPKRNALELINPHFDR